MVDLRFLILETGFAFIIIKGILRCSDEPQLSGNSKESHGDVDYPEHLTAHGKLLLQELLVVGFQFELHHFSLHEIADRVVLKNVLELWMDMSFAFFEVLFDMFQGSR